MSTTVSSVARHDLDTAEEVGEERHTLAWVARMPLTAIAAVFEDFKADAEASDDVESLIAWFDRQHATTGTDDPNAPG